MNRLRDLVRTQDAESNELDPPAASMDNQTVKSSEHAGERSDDASKRIRDRKRRLAFASLGMISVVVATLANVDHANDGRGRSEQYVRTGPSGLDDGAHLSFFLGRQCRLSQNTERWPSLNKPMVQSTSNSQTLRWLDPTNQFLFQYRRAS